MKTTVMSALILFLVSLYATGADAHLVPGLERETTLKRAEYVAEQTHKTWRRKATAHRWQHIISCESKFRKWARHGEHWGLTQMGDTPREACAWEWSIKVQLRATKCWLKRTGYYQWSCA